MKLLTRSVYLVTGFFALGYASSSAAEDFAASNCDAATFENTYYLLNVDHVGAVSVFFKNIFEKYFEDFEPFNSAVGERSRVESYFDIRSLKILDQQMELFIVTDENLPEYREGRERIVYKSNTNTSEDFMSEVKRYNKKTTALDKHPLFGKVKRKDRSVLLDKLKTLGVIAIDELDESLIVNHDKFILLISHFGVPVAEIVLDQFHITNYGLPNTNTLLRFEIYPEQLSQLKVYERTKLYAAFCELSKDFQQEFKELAPLSAFGYQQYSSIANNQLPIRNYFQRYPLLFTIGQIIILSFFGFLIIYLLLGRYSRRKNYRESKVGNSLSTNDQG